MGYIFSCFCLAKVLLLCHSCKVLFGPFVFDICVCPYFVLLLQHFLASVHAQKKHERFLSMPWGLRNTCKYRQETPVLMQGRLLYLFFGIYTVWSFLSSKACRTNSKRYQSICLCAGFHLCECKGTKKI